MTAAALVLASAMGIVFVAALVMSWVEDRRDWKEWAEDHAEPPSNLDRLDRGEDPWAL